jgi:hypothetical protein
LVSYGHCVVATRDQRGNQNLDIEGQTIQGPQETKGGIKSCISKDRKHNGHKIPKGESESVYRRTDNTMAKRYQRGNQNPYIEEEQTTQWPQDTKGVIIIRISKKNRQRNDQKKKYERTNNDLQNTHIKLKTE